jgi:hypothetical protein
MTAQAAEILIHKGEKLSLCTNPLGSYLQSAASPVKFRATSTALWRGYVGTWAIEGGRLYLVKLRGYIDHGDFDGPIEEVGLSHLFPDYPDGVFAHWYTGELRCPMGELLNYVHGGYGSTYEQDLFIEIEKGVVLSERIEGNGVGTGKGSTGYTLGAMTTFGRG